MSGRLVFPKLIFGVAVWIFKSILRAVADEYGVASHERRARHECEKDEPVRKRIMRGDI